MGMIINGMWSDTDQVFRNGRYIRPKSAYDAHPAADLPARLRAQPGRYHLLASLSCPWSHRTLLVRSLKDLKGTVPLQVVGEPRPEGYTIAGGRPWFVPGTSRQIRHLHQLYTVADPEYTGRATVPVLWDSEACTIVSNESAVLMRLFDAADRGEEGAITLVPPRLREEIDALNERLQRDLSNAVYRAGFAQRQDEYEEAAVGVFATLDYLEARLVKQRYLFGAVITETDWRLFPTLVRFDVVYHGHFKCARSRLIDYPNLWSYARELYAWSGIAETVDFDAIRTGYYFNDRAINPFGIVALAPDADWLAPHGRERLGPVHIALAAGREVAIDPIELRGGRFAEEET